MGKKEISKQIIKIGKLARQGKNSEYLRQLESLRNELLKEKRAIEEGIAIVTAKINSF